MLEIQNKSCLILMRLNYERINTIVNFKKFIIIEIYFNRSIVKEKCVLSFLQVFGYEIPHETKFLEVFYRGPSDQKLLTVANCCPNLRTLFLGNFSYRFNYYRYYCY